MSKQIESIKAFSCGSCSNQLALVFRGHPKEKRIFPAGVFLIKHKIYGYLLYDTGYGMQIWNHNWKYFLYRNLNPISFSAEESIVKQLEKLGISEEEISYIVLSHLHPDHIGGLSSFSKAKIILSQASYEAIEKSDWKELIFEDFFPKDIKERVLVLQKEAYLLEEALPFPSYALFPDKSLYLFEMSGHAKGQVLLFCKEWNLLLASDVAWSYDFIPWTKHMSFLAKKIQHNFSEYQKNIEDLLLLEKRGIKILFSHDSQKRKEEILDEKTRLVTQNLLSNSLEEEIFNS